MERQELLSTLRETRKVQHRVVEVTRFLTGVFIWHHFRDIVDYFPEIKEIT